MTETSHLLPLPILFFPLVFYEDKMMPMGGEKIRGMPVSSDLSDTVAEKTQFKSLAGIKQ